MLRAIWPSFRNIHNALPADADITSAQMIAYFIYWVIQLPLVMLGPAVGDSALSCLELWLTLEM